MLQLLFLLSLVNIARFFIQQTQVGELSKNCNIFPLNAIV